MRVQIQQTPTRGGWRWYVCDDEETYAMSPKVYATAGAARKAFGDWLWAVRNADVSTVKLADVPLFDEVQR